MAHNVTLIRGDGTGPELVEAAKKVLDATGVGFNWDIVEAGVDIMETAGTPLPPNVLESIRKNKVALKGPITTPIGTGFRSVNVALRKELDLYACIRPCKYYPGIRSKYQDVDLVIVRENTEDLYAGVEYDVHTAGSEADHRDGGRQNPRGLRRSPSSRSRSPVRAASSRPPSSTRASTAAKRSARSLKPTS